MGRKKKRIAAFDIETDPFKYMRTPEPFCCGFFDGEDYQDWWGDDCIERFIDYISDESDLIIYAHNGGKFDFFYLLDYLDPDVFIINGRIAKATLFGGRVELRDSWLILPLPLSAHDKDSIDYNKMEADVREQHKPEILKYLNKDCRSLWMWATDFIREFGTGLTLAGAAFKQLKKTSYNVTPTFDDYDTKFRPYYFGGRVQCFDVGEFHGTRKYVDINSAYSFAMLSRHWQGSQYVEKLKMPEDPDNASWFGDITARSWGALPYRHEGKLYFPDDGERRRYKATGWEILGGIINGTLQVTKVHRIYKPLFTSDFKEYVDKFFQMKHDAEVAGDKTRRQFAKLMLNSCYGKFGQDGRNFEKFCLLGHGEWPDDEHDDWAPYATTENGYSIFNRPDPVNRFYNVSTAASITGFVRAYLWDNIQKSEGVLYCDTDSIICKTFNGEIGDKIGQWDVEATATDVYIAQRKMYAMKIYQKAWPFVTTKTASKGVRLNFDQIKEGVETGKSLVTEREAPAFSLKYGARFFDRTTDFENLAKNKLTIPA